MQLLIDRYNEVKAWVDGVLGKGASLEERLATASCLLRVAQSCWNIGNFNSAKEIIDGFEENTREFPGAVPVLDALRAAFAPEPCPSAYEEALARARDMPECPVVPFFGQFLREIKRILTTPSRVLVQENLQRRRGQAHQQDDSAGRPNLRSHSNPRRPTGFPRTESIGECPEQEEQAGSAVEGPGPPPPSAGPELDLGPAAIRATSTTEVLDQLMSFHRHYHARATVATTDSLHRTLSSHTTALELAYMREERDEDDYHLDIDAYRPVEPLPYDHGVSFFPVAAPQTGMDLHLLQIMHHGTTLVHWEFEPGGASKTALVYARVDRACGTFFWQKPSWSLAASDYELACNPELPLPTVLVKRYKAQTDVAEKGEKPDKSEAEGNPCEQGYIDMSQVKEITIGCERERLPELRDICKRFGLLCPDACIGLMYGAGLAENKQMYLLCPPELNKIWYMGLCWILRGLRRQQQLTDRRSRWLKEKYLRLFYEDKGKLPVTRSAIRVFGGRDWEQQESTGSVSPIGTGTPRKKNPKNKKTKSISNLHGLGKDLSKTNDSGEVGLSSSSVFIGRGSRESLNRIMPSSPRSNKESLSHPRSPSTGSTERLVTPQTSFQRMLCFSRDKDKNGPGAGMYSMGFHAMLMQRIDFVDFVALFRSFILRARKDLKDLFGQLAITNRSQSDGSIREFSFRPFVLRQNSDATPQRIGLLTRNNSIDCQHYETDDNFKRKQFFDAISNSSMMQNCSGVDTSKSQVITLATFTKFLESRQQEKLTDEQIKELIKRHEPDPSLRTQWCLSFEGFARYMMDKDNYAFPNEYALPDEREMQQPLSHYYIASSHNTYLTGHQLKGESSVQLYAQVLLTGCRCVELDCWDGDDGSPQIYHGHTFVSKIPFRQVVEAIERTAFKTSPYPVILSIENHCSLQQQAKMAQIFQSVFGDKLVSEFLYESDFTDPQLPSPSQLRYRILIKNKKLIAEPGTAPATQPAHRPKVPIQERTASVKQMRPEALEAQQQPQQQQAGPSKVSAHQLQQLLLQQQQAQQLGPDSEEDDEDDDEQEDDQDRQQKFQIARELSDLVIYLQAIKFRGLNQAPANPSKPRGVQTGGGSSGGGGGGTGGGGGGGGSGAGQAQRHSIAGIGTGTTASSSGSPQSLSTSASIASGGSTAESLSRTMRTMPSCFQVSSFNENTAKKICRKQPTTVLAHSETQLIRTYPAAMRIDSSNFSPVIFWAFGMQMVALNYQTDDVAQALNAAMFEQNGQCGYVRKPSVMWDRTHMMYRRFNPWDKEFDGLHSAHLTLSIISGQYLAPGNLQASTYVEIELFGIPVDCAKHKTKTIQSNALNPIWNDKFCMKVMFKDLTFLRFAVFDSPSSTHHPIAQRVIPLRCLRPGYRHVRLRNSKNKPLPLSTLFIYSRLEEESLDYNTCPHHSKETSRRMASSTKEPEKLTMADPGLGGITLKRRMFFLKVHHVLASEPSTILKVTQESTTHEVMIQALQKANVSPDHVNEYILVEEVTRGWEKRTKEELPTQRVLDSFERPLEAQGGWQGQGRFILKRVGDDPSSRAWLASIRSTATLAKLSENGARPGHPGHPGAAAQAHQEYHQATHIWDEADTFLVCIYNVSPEIPYAILRVPVSSVAQDVLAQALVKARRMEEPANFVLVEELEWGGTEQFGASGKSQSRILEDDENVYSTQASWKTLGRFVLRERGTALPKKHLLPATLDRLSRGFSVGRSVSLPGCSKEKVPVTEALSDPTSKGLRRLIRTHRRREVHSDGEEARDSGDIMNTAQHLKRLTMTRWCAWKS